MVWLAGNLAAKPKREALARVASGEAQVVVGTHALFQDEVEFSRLGLAIVDEQHRFGVQQRLALRQKGGKAGARVQPHQLMMSATPIPRTLAMSYYADLDVSVIDEMPPGRTPVATRLVSDARRDEVIQRVRDACMAGSQAYWVCPLIEEAEVVEGAAPAPQKRGAAGSRRCNCRPCSTRTSACARRFRNCSVGLVHGRLAGGGKGRGDGGLQGGRDATAGGHHGDRGRRRRAERDA